MGAAGEGTAGEVRAALEDAYPARWAAEWDAVGPVCGADDTTVSRVLLAIDPTVEVVEEAIDAGAQMIVVHHPLHLRPVHGARPGGVLERCIQHGIALHVVHTNGDLARAGTSDTLWTAIGLTGTTDILEPQQGELLDLLHLYVPAAQRDAVINALADAGAGRIGAYDHCAYVVAGRGQFRPLETAHPTIGTVGSLEHVDEDRIEMVAPPSRRAALVAALRAAHPYEEPAFGFSTISQPADRGFGRIATVAPRAFDEFLAALTLGLNLRPSQVRTAGAPAHNVVDRIAVAAGAGDDAIESAAEQGAQVLVTSDLRHHRARDALDRRLTLVDVPHWSAERPWLAELASVIERAATVETVISTICTDPFAGRTHI